MAAAILVGGALLASAANAASVPQSTATSEDHNIYSGHTNSTATNAEHNMYAGHKASAGAPHGYNDAPGDHALGGGPG
jgi:hypothetical protein